MSRTPYPARQAAGPAGGILGGHYPTPGYGLGIGGMRIHDDFIGPILKADCATELQWDVVDIGAGIDLAGVLDGATELGILKAYTNSSSSAGGNVRLKDTRFVGGMPVGLQWAAKVRATNPSSALAVTAWSGLSSDPTVSPSVATNVSFIGIRAISTGASVDWFGVVKGGSTAANESTVDLGHTFDDTWHIFGCRRTSTGVQFFIVDASRIDRYGYLVDDIGAEITTNIPTADLQPVCIGINNGASGSHAAEVDFYTIAGTMARS
jgi:hypothetical protein